MYSKVGGWIKLIRSRLLSFGMIRALGFLLVVSLVPSAALSMAGAGGGARLLAIGRYWLR